MECHGGQDTVIPTQQSCASPWDFSHCAKNVTVVLLLFLSSRCPAQQPACCNTGRMETALPKEPAIALSKLICFQDPNPALLLGILQLSFSLPPVSTFPQQLSAEVDLLPAPSGGRLPGAALPLPTLACPACTSLGARAPAPLSCPAPPRQLPNSSSAKPLGLGGLRS